MLEKYNEFCRRAAASVKAKVANERGSQTLEWIGIAAVVVIVVGVISQAFSGDTSIGDTVKDKFTGFIESIGGG